MEYLMTYGWALLIIVVVGAALFALGILNPSTYTQSRCTGFQYFTFQDQKVAVGASTLDMLNGPRDVSVTGLNVNGQAAGVVRVNDAIAPQTVSPGSRFTVNGTYPTGKAIADSYSYPVQVTYNVIGGIQGNTDSGTCTGKVQ